MEIIAVFCGGVSAEHEVSIRSARNIIAAMDKKRFKPVAITVSRNATWYLHTDLDNLTKFDECCEPFYYGQVCTLMCKNNQTFILTEDGMQLKIDAAFPIIHGPMGEDGALQGLFEMMNLAYVGSNVLSSAIGMDKAAFKVVFTDACIPVVPFKTLNDKDHYLSYEAVSKELNSEILFVKPAVMGSSVGVTKVYSAKTYDVAIKQAFKYGTKVLVETFIPCRELECAVLGRKNPQASSIGEIKPNHDFYSYEAKYLDPNGADLIIPANIGPEIEHKIKDLAVKAFIALECSGLARVDFFLSHNNEIFVNEVNTLPGFTAISMYPKLWEHSGIDYADLITKLIDFAFMAHEEKQAVCLIPDDLKSCAAC